ncbi:hypothetical protein IPG41_00225 [Candidatus Peregrinibacteria bacterium]|nr:MAG: hypothetical protein IPG41_00225 [Candidatus Peregrinibacteria bacterium]
MKKRVFKFFIPLVLAFLLVLSLTHLQIFPCETFIWDSTQGYYFSLCALIDEDGKFLFPGDPYYGPILTIWTWLSAFGILLVLPYLLALGLNRILKN